MFKPKKKSKEPESFEKAYDYAVFLLSIKLRTVGEVKEKLLEKGYVGKVVEEVIRSLKENRYVDDQRYAEIFLDNLKKYKYFGYYGIKKKFMERRLPQKLIEEVLEEGLPVEEELKIATRLLKKEGLKLDGEGLSQEEKQKVAQRLRARGFKSEVISRLVF